MERPPRVCTVLLPGFGLVTCQTEDIHNDDGTYRFTRLLSAVDEDGRPVDPRTWGRIERVLGTR